MPEKTYYFTSATPSTIYAGQAQNLVNSGRSHGINIDVLQPKQRGAKYAKYLKLLGILHAPVWADRIVFLDADCLIIDPSGINDYNGSCKTKKTTPLSQHTFRAKMNADGGQARRMNNLLEAAKENGVTEFRKGHKFLTQTWWSGVITGHRQFMIDLAKEWVRWWDIILECNEGTLWRDQISYKFAYMLTHRKKYGFTDADDLPVSYNYAMVKFLDCFPENVNILHLAGAPPGWMKILWNKHIVPQAINGTYKGIKKEDHEKLLGFKPRLDILPRMNSWDS